MGTAEREGRNVADGSGEHARGRMPVGARALAFLTLLVLVAGLAGCSFVRLSSDIELIKKTALVTGRVRGAAPSGGTVFVVLTCQKGRERVRARVERLPAGVTEYGLFVAPTTACYIAAFQDGDGDTRWEPGERVGVLSGGQPVFVGAQEQETLPDLALADGPIGGGWKARDLDLTDQPIPARLPFARGEVTTLENPIFDPKRADEGMWTPLSAAMKTGFGVFMLEEYDPNRIPVVFVHGIRGSPRDFRAIVDTLDRKRYQPWVVYYPSGIRLHITAHVMHDVLLELCDRLGVKSLVVVAHSMGGLVSRATILEMARGGHAGIVQAFVTLSTPYEGQASAGTGVRLAPSAVPSWIDMTPGSDLLESLRLPLPKEIRFYLFFAHGPRSNIVGGNNDGVVTLQSQLARYAQADAARLFGYPVEHTAILSDAAAVKDLQTVLAGLWLSRETGGDSLPR